MSSARFEPILSMPAYLAPSTPTKTDISAHTGRGRMIFLLRLLFALSGLVAMSAVARAVVAAPVFSPAAGTYLSAQTMTLSTATNGASIAYTMDGSTPTESGGTITHGSLYTIPLTINATTTLQAIAFASGNTDSPVTSATYTINSLPTVAAPVFSPAGGTYTSVQPVMITSATNGATIRYTTNGSTPSPTVGMLFYPGSLTIGATTTLNAIAYEAGYNPSAVTSASYTINLPTPAAAPVFSPGGGTYTSVQSVTISTTSSGASIAYTTDGTTPTEVGGNITHGSLYTGAISMNTTIVLQAIAFGGGHTDSPMTSATYIINLPPPAAAPTFSIPAGTYGQILSVAIGSLTNGASIAYTTDGSTPTEAGGTVTHGTLLSNGGTVTISTTTTLNAIAFANGCSDSALVTAAYTILQAAAPTFSPGGGNFTTDATDAYPVTITSATSGATIYYTINGTSPLTNPSYQIANGGTAYLSGSASGNNITLTAVATASGNIPSSLSTATYTVTIPQAAAPTFNPGNGTQWRDTDPVTITSATSGATIYYTTDGSSPVRGDGSIYGIPIANGGSVILKQSANTVAHILNAVAVANGYTPSPTSGASYLVTGWVEAGTNSQISTSGGTQTFKYWNNSFNGFSKIITNTYTTSQDSVVQVWVGPGYLVWDEHDIFIGGEILMLAIYQPTYRMWGIYQVDSEKLGTSFSVTNITTTSFHWTGGSQSKTYGINEQRLAGFQPFP
jgi:hypothetical protein